MPKGIKPTIFAVDFDGTLCAEKWPDIGEPNIKLIDFLKEKKKEGNEVVLWTMREGAHLDEAVKWCASYGLYFDAVNDNVKRMKAFFKNNPRKVFANFYIDDHNDKSGLFNLPFVESAI